MRKSHKRLAVAVMAGAFTLGLAAPAFAGDCGGGEARKCNSGRGNGSETNIQNDCDPGNSGGHNNGGD